jgi:hypothetical protein
MNKPLDENAKLDITVSNIMATNEEIEEFKKTITTRLKDNCTLPVSVFKRVSSKGNIYEVTFTVLKPKHFNLDLIGHFLHTLKIVGFRIEGTYVE